MNWVALLISGVIAALLFGVCDLIHRYFDDRAVRQLHRLQHLETLSTDIFIDCSQCDYRRHCSHGAEPCRGILRDSESE